MPKVLTVDPTCPDAASLAEGARVLAAGGLVVFPTETVYGLGADPANAAAVERVYAAKDRPAGKALSLHLADAGQVEQLAVAIPPAFWRAAAAFWPGPLAAVLRRAPDFAPWVSAGLETVSLRLPDHPVALRLAAALGRPLAGTSANLSGRASPATATAALAELGERADLFLDSGPCPLGRESTVVDFTVDPPLILRLGSLSRESLAAVLGEVRLYL